LRFGQLPCQPGYETPQQNSGSEIESIFSCRSLPKLPKGQPGIFLAGDNAGRKAKVLRGLNADC
jgi:hypothetical protein